MYPIQIITHSEPARATTMAIIIPQNSGLRLTPPESAIFMPLIAEAMIMVRISPAQPKLNPRLTIPAGPTIPVPSEEITNGWAVICARAKPRPPSATIRDRP